MQHGVLSSSDDKFLTFFSWLTQQIKVKLVAILILFYVNLSPYIFFANTRFYILKFIKIHITWSIKNISNWPMQNTMATLWIITAVNSFHTPWSVSSKPKQTNVFKGTVSVILSDPPCKNGNARLTTVPLQALSDQVIKFFYTFCSDKGVQG